MVKSETRQDAEILVKNPSPRLLGKKFRDSNKGKTKPCKNEASRVIKNALKISRSCQNFPRPTFFEVPFATPHSQSVSIVFSGPDQAFSISFLTVFP